MGRRTALIVLVWLWMSIAMTSTAQNKQVEASAVAASETVEYCRLMLTPSEFVGKSLRVRVVFKNLISMGSILTGDCDSKQITVSAGFSKELVEELSDGRSPTLNSLEIDNASVVVVGRFLGPKKPASKFNYGHYGWSQYRFEIQRFEKIDEKVTK